MDTRKLLRAVARTNSTCGILAHNHPTGLAIPSEADRLTTYHIMEVTGQLGFTIMDHIIIAGEDGCSMLNRGSLPEYRKLLIHMEHVRRGKYDRADLICDLLCYTFIG